MGILHCAALDSGEALAQGHGDLPRFVAIDLEIRRISHHVAHRRNNRGSATSKGLRHFAGFGIALPLFGSNAALGDLVAQILGYLQ